MQFLRGVAAILLVVAGAFAALALLWVVGLTFLWDGPDWGLALGNGALAVGALALMSTLARFAWPRTRRRAHR